MRVPDTQEKIQTLATVRSRFRFRWAASGLRLGTLTSLNLSFLVYIKGVCMTTQRETLPQVSRVFLQYGSSTLLRI